MPSPKNKNLATIHRNTRDGFVQYMMANPEYFKQQFDKKEVSKEIINKQFDQLQKECLICGGVGANYKG